MTGMSVWPPRSRRFTIRGCVRVSLGRIDPSAGIAATSGGAPIHRPVSHIHRSVEPGLTESRVWRPPLRLGLSALEDLTKAKESEILRLHGMGPKAMRVLRDALTERGLSFRDG